MKYLAVYGKEDVAIFNEQGYNAGNIHVTGEDIKKTILSMFRTIKFFDNKVEFKIVEMPELSKSSFLAPTMFTRIWNANDKITSNQANICPFCGNEHLKYYSAEYLDNIVYFPWKCTNCSHSGFEYYEMTFCGHHIMTNDGEEIEITDDMIEKDNL